MKSGNKRSPDISFFAKERLQGLEELRLFRILYAGFAGLNEFSELSAWSHSPKMFVVNIYIQDSIEPELPTDFLEGAPDLTIEVLSPGHTIEEIDDKLVEYFENGARLVWVINSNQHYALIYRSAQEPDRLLKSIDSLDGEDIIPGFGFPLADLF